MSHDPEFAEPAPKAPRSPSRPSVLPWVMTLCWWIAVPFLGWWLTQSLLATAGAPPRSFNATAAREIATKAKAQLADVAPHIKQALLVIEWHAEHGHRTVDTYEVKDCPPDLRAQFVKAIEARGFTVTDADEARYGKGCLTIRW